MRRALLCLWHLSGSCWGAEMRVSRFSSCDCAAKGKRGKKWNERCIWDHGLPLTTTKPATITMATVLCGWKVSWKGAEANLRAETDGAHGWHVWTSRRSPKSALEENVAIGVSCSVFCTIVISWLPTATSEEAIINCSLQPTWKTQQKDPGVAEDVADLTASLMLLIQASTFVICLLKGCLWNYLRKHITDI